MNPIIVIARAEAEKQAAYELRYQVGCREGSLPSLRPGHEEGELRDALDSAGHIVVAWDKGQIVATARVNFVEETPLDPDTWAILDRLEPAVAAHRVSITSRFVVSYEYRHSTLPLDVMRHAYGLARRRGVDVDVVMARPTSAPFFQALGYTTVGEVCRHSLFGEILPLSLDVQEDGLLRSRASSFGWQGRETFWETTVEQAG